MNTSLCLNHYLQKVDQNLTELFQLNLHFGKLSITLRKEVERIFQKIQQFEKRCQTHIKQNFDNRF